MPKINFLKEKEQAKTLLSKAGVKEEHAEIVAECFVTADMYGVTSHGTAILPALGIFMHLEISTHVPIPNEIAE